MTCQTCGVRVTTDEGQVLVRVTLVNVSRNGHPRVMFLCDRCLHRQEQTENI